VAIPGILKRLKARFQDMPLSEVTTRDVEEMISDLREAPRQAQNAQNPEILALARQGLTRPEIAARLGLNYGTVQKKIRRAALNTRNADAHPDGDGYAPASVQAHISYLRAAMRYAHKKGELPVLPWFPSIKVDNARTGFFEREEFERIVTCLPDPHADVARFGYGCGWRLSEILELQWSNVNRKQGVITIQHTKNGHGRVLPLVGELAKIMERRWEARIVGELLGAARKTRGAEILALTEQGFARRQIAEKLGVSRDLIRHAQNRKRIAGVPAVDARRDLSGTLSEWVFHRAGKPIPKARFWQVWSAARNQAGLPGRLFHDLRRTAARDMIAAGCDYQTAMAVTGHRSMSMFLRYQIVDVRGIERGLRALDAHRNGP
jgi:integrase